MVAARGEENWGERFFPSRRRRLMKQKGGRGTKRRKIREGMIAWCGGLLFVMCKKVFQFIIVSINEYEKEVRTLCQRPWMLECG
jgi:hypothetical protein